MHQVSLQKRGTRKWPIELAALRLNLKHLLESFCRNFAALQGLICLHRFSLFSPVTIFLPFYLTLRTVESWQWIQDFFSGGQKDSMKK